MNFNRKRGDRAYMEITRTINADKRYYIDAFTKYQNAVSPQTKQPNGLEKAMEILEKLTTADAKYIQGFNVNQVDSILILLQSNSDNQYKYMTRGYIIP